MVSSAAPQPQNPRMYDRLEAMFARGAAAFGATRWILQSGMSPLFATPPVLLALFAIYLTPVAAVEALLLATILVLCGAAKYWPINFLAFALGSIGLGGFLSACLQWADATSRAPPRRAGQKRAPPRRRPLPPRESTDNQGALIVLVIGSLFASLIGALP